MSQINFETLDEDLEAYVQPRQRRPRINFRRNHKPKKTHWDIVSALAERGDPAHAGRELFLGPSLNATREEREWIVGHLNQFFHGKKITAVLRRVKGGKEANVYCCAAHPSTGLPLLAAKLYRPRMLCNLRNDARYRQGRPMLSADGQPIGQRDWRMHKAIKQKSRTGLEAQQTSWLEYEFQTLQRLHDAGADVPRPFWHGDHALLMEYIGDEALPAPALVQVRLAPAEARALFDQLLDNVELMLAQGCVHGDFSAYNVLYWDGAVKIIDFPQVVDPHANPDARAIFQRDVERLCQHFMRYAVRADAAALARELWSRHATARYALEAKAPR